MEVSITGAKIYYVIPGINYPITQTVVNAWIAMVVIVGLCIWLTRGMQVHARTKRQVVAEMIVQMAQKLVRGNMGAKWDSFVPFIAAILSMSVVSSLMGLTGAYSPTNDLNTFLAWGILVFVLITYHKIKANGFGGYLKGFTEPIFVMTPMNIISEIATPVSMSLRHFANICCIGSSQPDYLFLAARLIGHHSVFTGRYSGCAQCVFFCFLRLRSAVHFLYADDAVRRTGCGNRGIRPNKNSMFSAACSP